MTSNWAENYSYDRYGNRTGITATGTIWNGSTSSTIPTDGVASQSYDAVSNRITTSGYIYDLAGNMVRGQDASGAWQQYDYDTAGRLTRVWNDAKTYVEQDNGYGASRQREVTWSSASGNLTWFVWGGSSVIAEYTGTFSTSVPLSWTKSYIYAGSRLLSTFTNNGSGGETLEFQHPDRLGTRLVTNEAANTSFEQTTLPFGTSLDAETTGTTNERFTSYDRSAVANLDYAVNRSYSSGQGRFTQVDPLEMEATSMGNPQSLNLYAYVQNNPVDFTDPSGLDSDDDPPGKDPKDEGPGIILPAFHVKVRIGVESVKEDRGVLEDLIEGHNILAAYEPWENNYPTEKHIGAVIDEAEYIGGRLAAQVIWHICDKLFGGLKYVTRPIEDHIGQSVLPDAVKIEGSLAGVSLSIQQDRDGRVNGGIGGAFDAKQFFVDIPAAIAKGTKLAPSVNISFQKILQWGIVREDTRQNTFTGLSGSAAGGFVAYGGLDVSSGNGVRTLNIGYGYGVNVGTSYSQTIGRTCSAW